MKSEITIYCDSEAELQEFVQRLLSVPQGVPSLSAPAAAAGESAPSPATPVRTRKPRSDAGQPRGPYNKSTGTPAASESGHTGESIPAQTPPAAPAAPTQSAAPVSPAVPSGGAQPAPASAAAELKIEDVKAALKIVNDTPGLGMATVMGVLASFSIDRISALPKEKYVEFRDHCVKLVNDHKAAKK